jgi:hypothetical protein
MNWLLPLALLAATLPPPADPALKDGVARLDEGDLHGALASLDAAARAMGEDPAHRVALAQAHLYIGLAYVKLDQAALARDRFRRALALDVHAAPDARFDAAASSLFQQARATSAPDRPPRKGGTGALVPAALFAGAGVGAATLAGSGGPEPAKASPNDPPTGGIHQSPPGALLVGVTRAVFTANGHDPDGDALVYRWDFGDGDKGEGPMIEHLFTRAGTFDVHLSIDDGRDRVDIVSRVTVRTLSGSWTMDAPGYRSETGFRLQQDGGTLQGAVEFNGGAIQGLGFNTRILPPRNLFLTWSDPGSIFSRGRCSGSLQALLDEDMMTATGVALCSSCDICQPQKSDPMTIRRR